MTHPTRRLLAASALVCCIADAALGQTPAFPGALGFGANATGGRGGAVYHVTTLADSGAGSFRDAVSHSGRIVVFDVGGYIKLNTAVSVQGNITIAGQTAPGGGIGFRGGEISFANRSNIICRYLRIRPGTETADPVNDDALSLYRARSIICDHCSFAFGPWNNIDAVSDDWQNYPVTDVTFQNCLDANPTGQQFGAHTESVSSTMSWFYTIFANSHNRNPLSKINDVFVNNVLYNCSAGYTTHTSTTFDHDIVNNYFIAGPASGGNFPWYQIDINQSIYYSGNLYDANSDGALNGDITTPYWYQGEGTVLTSPWSLLTATIPLSSTAAAYRISVSQAGALPRDQVDDLVLSQVKKLGSGTVGTGAGTAGPDGGLYTSQAQTGLGNNGYGSINGGVAPIDTDQDGMPDYWEKAAGLNPNSSSDAMTIGADGYANLERYLNWLAEPHAFAVTNTAVDVNLWQWTSGFTNASPLYTLSGASNGVVSLISGHIAHFVPAANFAGLGGFQFSVLASDGTGYTNAVIVAVSPQVPPSNLIWQGDGVNNVWGNGAGTNWLDGTNLVAFASGDNVTFDDSGSITPAVNLSGTIAAGNVYVLAAQDYTFAGGGSLVNPTALVKTGSGRLTVLTTNTTAGGLIINDGVVEFGDGVSASGSIGGNITNSDTLIFNNPGTVSSSASISGSGVLIKRGAGALTLSGTQTFTNLTTIEAGSLTFSGTPPAGDVTNAGTLGLSLSSSMTYAAFISGPGNVSLNASGQTTTIDRVNTYTGGTTNSNGTLVLANNSAVGSGPVTYLAGAVKPASGIVVTNTFVLPGSTTDLMMDTYNGNATWAGDIVATGGGASFRPGGTTGTLVLTGTAALGGRNFIVPRGTVEIGGNANFSATGSTVAFGRNTSQNSSTTRIKQNAVCAFGPVSLGGGTASGGKLTLGIQDSASFTTGLNNFDIHNSTAAAAITILNLDGGTFTVGGIAKTRTGSTQYSTNNFNGGTLRASQNNASFLPALSGLFCVVKSGGASIDDGGNAITIAAPLAHDPALGAAADGGLVKLGAGTLTLAGASTFNGPTMVNAGTLALAGSIASSAGLYVGAGATFDASAPGSFILGSGRMLWGNGSVVGNFSVSGGATLSPGSNAIGNLSFGSALTLAAGSTNRFEISKAPLTNDSVTVAATVFCNGTLIVTRADAAALAPGDRFKLFDAVNYSGSFSSVQLPAPGGGLAWDTSALSTAGTISVVAAPPVFNHVELAGGNFMMSGTGGVPATAYYLLTATNAALPLTNWARVATNQFQADGNFTNTFAPGEPQRFYRLQLP